ncbi:hypothetical protein HYH03_019168 [Edaphochlamys debaryana]|uniref:Uncharacterized protein n=1 Tax=Edaphochlamys debaryana TaxID=47281 RepID=A0A836BNM3_9CHLO|nr:hypothetical protein HYH03_019168 [Edaphochlamys debaryana]|eukprot:KAG2481869.1 hypothetical protein HYH03_019168 [Edaphochlamys debaryana]
MQAAIEEQRFPDWVRNYLRTMFPKGDVPGWVRDAMVVAGISLEGVAGPLPEGRRPGSGAEGGAGAEADGVDE